MAMHTHEEHAHAQKISFYTKTLWMLMILLVVTVWAGYWKVPDWLGIGIALTIAVTKATIVIMNFMHVRFSSKLAWLSAGAGFFWLIIMFAFAFADYVSRRWEPEQGW